MTLAQQIAADIIKDALRRAYQAAANYEQEDSDCYIHIGLRIEGDFAWDDLDPGNVEDKVYIRFYLALSGEDDFGEDLVEINATTDHMFGALRHLAEETIPEERARLAAEDAAVGGADHP